MILRLVASVLSLGLAPAIVFSDEPPVELTPFIAEGENQRVDLGNVPSSTQSLDEAFLEDFAFDSLAKAFTFVPGASATSQSNSFAAFAIRGVSSDEGDAFIEPRIAVFQDGIPISAPRGSSVALYDLEAIEILKGPQVSRFGQGASAGAVHLVRHKAEWEEAGRVAFGVGNYHARELDGFLNTVLEPEVWANRFAFHAKVREGYIRNLAGGNLMSEETLALRNSLRWQPSPEWRVDLVGDFERNTPDAVAFHQGRFPTSTGSTDIYGPAELNRGEALQNEREILSLALTIEGLLTDHWTFVSTTAGRQFDSRRELDADGSQALAFEVTDLMQHRQLSQEIRLVYDSHASLRGSIGVSALWQKRKLEDIFLTNEQEFWPLLRPLLRANLTTQVQNALLDAGLPPGVAAAQAEGLAQLLLPPAEDTPMIDSAGVVQPVNALPQSFAYLASAPAPLNAFAALAGLPLPAGLHSESYHNSGEQKVYDLFGNAAWDLSEQFTLNVGARLTHEALESGYRSDAGSSPSVIGFIPITSDRPAYPNAFFPVDAPLKASERITSVLGEAALTFHWDENTHLRASVSHGRRPPVLRLDENGFTRLAEERIWNYEAGFESTFWDDRILIETNLFLFDYEHFQTLTIEDGRRRSLDAGSARAEGFEVTLRAQPRSDFLAFLAYGYTHFRFDAESTNGEAQLFAGNQPRLTPDHSLAVGFQWQRTVGGGIFEFSPAWTWQSRVYFENDNNPALSQEAYGLLSLKVAYRRGAWSLEAWMDNALEEAYLLDAGNIGNDLGLPTYVPGPPRLFGLGMEYQF